MRRSAAPCRGDGPNGSRDARRDDHGRIANDFDGMGPEEGEPEVDENTISNQAASRIARAVQNHSTRLDLRSLNLKEFPKELLQMHRLTELDLSGNRLSSLPEEISKMTNVSLLNLSNNKLSELPDTFSQLTNLTALHLRNNGLSTLT